MTKYQDLLIEEKTKLTNAGYRNCQYSLHGMWLDCPENGIVFFNFLREYRVNPNYMPPVKTLGRDSRINELARDYGILPVQSHKNWLQDRATVLVMEVLRFVKLGKIDEVSIEYCTQLIAILVELKEMNDA